MSIQDPREIEKVKVVMLKGEKGEAGDVTQTQMESAISEAVGAEETLRQQADATLEREISDLDDAKADKTEVNALATDKANQSALLSEITSRTNGDANLQAQIDQIVAPSGEAPNPSEIINARIGINNGTYNSLGNAIRNQIKDVRASLFGITKGQEYTFDFSELEVYQDGAFMLDNGTIVQNANHKILRLSCNGIQAINITSQNFVTALVYFVKHNNVTFHNAHFPTNSLSFDYDYYGEK